MSATHARMRGDTDGHHQIPSTEATALLRFKPIAFIALMTALVASAFTAAGASAATPDAPWSATGTGTTTTTSDGTTSDPVLDYSVNGSSGNWKFSATAKTARKQPVEWRYKGYHAWYQVRVAIEKFVIRNGTEIVTETLPAPARSTAARHPRAASTTPARPPSTSRPATSTASA